jgi:PEP-CTERM motif
MKTLLRFFILLNVFALKTALAQGTLYLSNLGQPPNSLGTGVGSSSWCAQSFNTGTFSDGYDLASIQLSLSGSFAQNGNTLIAYLYTDNHGVPGTSLTPLDGLNPGSKAIYSYTADGVLLSSSTTYWIAVTSTQPVSTVIPKNFYLWFTTTSSSYTASDDWSINAQNYVAISNDGTRWFKIQADPFLFAVDATPVPEPASLAVLGIGIFIYAIKRRA